MVQKRGNLGFDIILELLKGENHIRGLATSVGCSHVTVMRELNKLLKENVLDFRTKGKNKTFFIKGSAQAKSYIAEAEQYKQMNMVTPLNKDSKGEEGVATKPDVKDNIFNALDVKSSGFITKGDLLSALADEGILESDTRIKETIQNIARETKNGGDISQEAFKRIIGSNITLIEKALTGKLVIPDFRNFCSHVTNIYNRTTLNKAGDVPPLTPKSASNPEAYAISICTVDGQRFNIGNFDSRYLLEATCKPINYCLALDESNEETVHKKVGLAPQEKGFHYLMLNSEGIPHNPMNTAGGVMTLSLIKSELDSANKFKHILKTWEALAGDAVLDINKDAVSTHAVSSDKEYTVTYFMRENKLMPKNIGVREIVDLFFQCHSIEITTSSQAVVAATLANAGVCPITGKKIFKPRTVKNCLSLMYSSGMEGFNSGFGFIVGLPAKSGVSGAIMLVVPNVMGICIWSPKIDQNGISVRGLDFCKKFIEKFNFHNYDSLMKTEDKTDPRLQKNEAKMRGVMALVDAASRGDLFEVQRLVSVGIDINDGDYDDRTPLHLAASEGHLNVVEFLINNNVEISPKDRWGGTPLADAERGQHKDVISLLEKHGGRL